MASLSGGAKKTNIVVAGLFKKIWFFPAILFAIVLILGLLQISGSSMGIYHELFYGDTSKDPNLLLNKPRPVRSDEWLVTTQLALGQTKNNFAANNKNIGDGIDVSLLVDAPTTDFGQLFKPQNFAFFILPVGIAFALKWWLLAYFLVISVYFFVLALLPKKILLAVLLSLGFLASPFIGWWYQYITIAPIYCTLFGIVVTLRLLKAHSTKAAALWGLLLAYIGVAFALVLYPPFQIPCILFALAFLIGFIIDNKKLVKSNLRPVLIGSSVAVVVMVMLVAACLVPKLSIIKTISETAYPGNRLTESGGYNPLFFLASNTSPLDQSNSRAGAFKWLQNQSEGSNFILVFTLLIPVLAFFAIKYRRKVPYFWTILMITCLTLLFVVWLFVPGIDALGKITLLDRVLPARLLMGFGLINLSAVVLFIAISEKKEFKLPRYLPIGYAGAVLLLYLLLDFYIVKLFPGFMGRWWAIALALPYPVILYLLLKRRFILSAIAFLVFSVGSVVFIHPLYVGVSTLSDSEVSRAIQQVDPGNSQRWVTDSLQLENFAILNGKQSLSGVYAYPDLQLWRATFASRDRDKYNRYAHVRFIFDRDAQKTIMPTLQQPSPDQLLVDVEPCGEFLRENNTGYILTTQSFTTEQAPCAHLAKTVVMPRAIVYIYKLNIE